MPGSRRCRVRIDRRTDLALIVLAGAMLLAPPRARLAWGQDDWDAEGRASGAEAARMRPAQVDVEANLNQWIFGGGASIAQTQRRIDSLLTLRLNSLEGAGGLSKAQVEKLRLAGRNDVARFFRKVDAVKQECRGMNFNDQRFQQIWPKIHALQAEFNSGLFDEKSLFHKVLQGMSRCDSSAPYQEQERERRQFRHRATIELAVAMFEMGVPLTEVQRQKFLKLLFEKLDPPKSFGSQDQYVVFYQASKLDEGKLKPIFDDAQWRALSVLLRSAKGMEAHLRNQGFIP